MQAIILCGGKGTRLSALYPDRPKALVPILNQPFISWQLKWLASAGIHAVHIAAGYMASAIRDWIVVQHAEGYDGDAVRGARASRHRRRAEAHRKPHSDQSVRGRQWGQPASESGLARVHGNAPALERGSYDCRDAGQRSRSLRNRGIRRIQPRYGVSRKSRAEIRAGSTAASTS